MSGGGFRPAVLWELPDEASPLSIGMQPFSVLATQVLHPVCTRSKARPARGGVWGYRDPIRQLKQTQDLGSYMRLGVAWLFTKPTDVG